MTSPQRSPRLAGVLLADLDRDPAARIKYGLLLEALARRFGEGDRRRGELRAGESIEDIITPGRTGALVPPEDPAALAEALVELLPWRARLERWGRVARAQVETQFTWDKVVARLAPALESAAIAATRSSGPRLPLANRHG